MSSKLSWKNKNKKKVSIVLLFHSFFFLCQIYRKGPYPSSRRFFWSTKVPAKPNIAKVDFASFSFLSLACNKFPSFFFFFLFLPLLQYTVTTSPPLIANGGYHSSLSVPYFPDIHRRLNRMSGKSPAGAGSSFRQTRLRMTVLSLVGNDEHVGVILGSLNVLPRRTPSHATALVIPSANNKKKKINFR